MEVQKLQVKQLLLSVVLAKLVLQLKLLLLQLMEAMQLLLSNRLLKLLVMHTSNLSLKQSPKLAEKVTQSPKPQLQRSLMQSAAASPKLPPNPSLLPPPHKLVATPSLKHSLKLPQSEIAAQFPKPSPKPPQSVDNPLPKRLLSPSLNVRT